MSKNSQLLPVLIAIGVFIVLSVAYYILVLGLNSLPVPGHIHAILEPSDVLIGTTIYLKTAIDFALLIGILMNTYKGFKNRVAIEIGTAIGNALGTFAILILWFFFKEITWLLAIMIIFASIVLLKMAETSLEHVESKSLLRSKNILLKVLHPINNFFDPLLSRIMPNMEFNSDKKITTFAGLFLTSCTIPFILGTDDFAGYISLFTEINVFGFGIGVFLGHMILNICLFAKPDLTIKIIKNPIVALLGSLAFIIIAILGFKEAIHLFF